MYLFKTNKCLNKNLSIAVRTAENYTLKVAVHGLELFRPNFRISLLASRRSEDFDWDKFFLQSKHFYSIMSQRVQILVLDYNRCSRLRCLTFAPTNVSTIILFFSPVERLVPPIRLVSKILFMSRPSKETIKTWISSGPLNGTPCKYCGWDASSGAFTLVRKKFYKLSWPIRSRKTTRTLLRVAALCHGVSWDI